MGKVIFYRFFNQILNIIFIYTKKIYVIMLIYYIAIDIF